MNYTDSPITIVGAARSGTSMTAGVVHMCGAWKGDTGGPHPNNKKGMFENLKLREDILKPYLRSIGCDPLGQKRLPRTNDLLPVHPDLAESFREKTLVEIRRQGYDGTIPWMYKGAKLCLIWPVWLAAFPGAKWIIVRRDAEAIVRSCLKTGFMRAYRDRSGWLDWIAKHERKFEEMHAAGLQVMEVWPQRMVNGDFTQMQMCINWLGLVWNDKRVREFVAPDLWSCGGGTSDGVLSKAGRGEGDS